MATVPGATTWVDGPRPVSSSSAYMQFVGTSDGGSPIIEWQIGYGVDLWTPQLFVSSGGASTIPGLNNAFTYYFWARGRNAIGWGPWSARGSARPWTVPGPPSSVKLSLVTQNSLRTTFTAGPNDGGSPILEWQLGFGLDPNTPQTLLSSNGINNLGGLDPGKTYYFWARGRNSVGWGAWSTRSLQTLIAGARVNDGIAWKRAVPYVRVGGVWKLARPRVRNAGIWKETKT